MIEIIGARQHNLKDIDVSIPKNKLVVFTGVSGSGKSSLVFDTIYAEAQRQLIETFSSFARRRLPKISRPDVDGIKNISTTITIDQKKLGNNPRSTVGTVTELYTYLRLLFSRVGEPLTFDSRFFGFNNPYGMCPKCRGLGRELEVDLDLLIDWNKSINTNGLKHKHFQVGKYFWKTITRSKLFDNDKPFKDWSKEELDKLLYTEKFTVVDPENEHMWNVHFEGIVKVMERRITNGNVAGNQSFRFFRSRHCSECGGSRLNEQARNVIVNGKTIPELVEFELTDLLSWLETIKGQVADPIVNRMKPVLRNLISIGVGYLNLNRAVGTLSGGESQRVKMARQLGCDLIDMTYVFDEPSIGLHQRDIRQLTDMLEELRDKGNTVLVVEHDPAVIERSEYIIDIGPRAGRHGGNIVFTGTYDELLKSDSITSEMLKKNTEIMRKRRKRNGKITVENASIHNLKNITVDIPTGIFVCVTGVAGSGKSSLMLDVFARQHPESVIIDQSGIFRSSRSNAATFIKAFDYIRKEFSKETGEKTSIFSFNSEGACPRCKGTGALTVEMFFLDAVKMTCPECEGKRYREEVLKHTYKDKNINQVLRMTASEALEFFESPQICRRLQILNEVGLGYLQLGQPLSTLSGGEAQRMKLARELHKKGNIYILDEPTTGLHMADIERLLEVINRLVDGGNTVIVIEHNLDVIKNADWVIDMGPEGGSKGGEIIAEGTPEEIIRVDESYTGRFLENILK
jgi:excinuclease UvrABC ATPase subunit